MTGRSVGIRSRRNLKRHTRKMHLTGRNVPIYTKQHISKLLDYLVEVQTEENMITNPDIIKINNFYNNLLELHPDSAKLIKDYTQQSEPGEDDNLLINYNVINYILKHIDNVPLPEIPIELKACNFDLNKLQQQVISASKLKDVLVTFPTITESINVFRGYNSTEINNKYFVPDRQITLPRFISTSVFLEATEGFYYKKPQYVMAIKLPSTTIVPFIGTLQHREYSNFNKRHLIKEGEVLLPLGVTLKYTGTILEYLPKHGDISYISEYAEKLGVSTTKLSLNMQNPGTKQYITKLCKKYIVRLIHCFDFISIRMETRDTWSTLFDKVTMRFPEIDYQIQKYKAECSQSNSNSGGALRRKKVKKSSKRRSKES
jgi:chromosome condensin MukBEF MukE localization factor